MELNTRSAKAPNANRMQTMSVWWDIAKVACDCLFFTGNVIVEAAVKVDEWLDEARSPVNTPKRREQREKIRSGLRAHRQTIISDLLEINEEYQARRRKHSGDKGDKEKLDELAHQIKEHKELLWDHQSEQIRQKYLDSAHSVSEAPIDAEHLHVAQYHIGQPTAGKPCPRCYRPMVLQFPREEQLRVRNESRGLSPMHLEKGDIYWGCTGYYQVPSCKQTVPYNLQDAKIFTPKEVEEFTVTQSDLETIYSNPSVQRGAADRLREHQREQTDDYLCPEHGLPLALCEKKNFKGALDQFFLGCPMWKGGDRGSCQFIVKLKSPAQLAAALRDREGRGVI
jgi:hypothetical protein